MSVTNVKLDSMNSTNPAAFHSMPPRAAGGGVAPRRTRPAPAKTLRGGGAGGAAKYADGGGPTIQIARVQLIYWGAAWAAAIPPTPSADQVTAAMQSILAGPYMIGLAQYRQVGRGHLLGATVYSASDPPNPFSDSDVSNFVSARIADNTVPGLDEFNQNLYLVVMPQGVNSSGSFIGEHTFYTDGNGNNVHFGWITNDGTLNDLTSILSHELVESCTDPEGNAITGVAGTCSQGGWCEIGDICYVNDTINGVTVQKYWSDADGACIAPNWPQVSFPVIGVQFRDTLPANSTFSWFTYDWPEYQVVDWSVVPVTPEPGAPEISWQTQIERASGAYLTYWITVTNLTSADIEIEGRFRILG